MRVANTPKFVEALMCCPECTRLLPDGEDGDEPKKKKKKSKREVLNTARLLEETKGLGQVGAKFPLLPFKTGKGTPTCVPVLQELCI